ncbi:Rab family, other [Strigomonas culicis]|uniref:Rab family, other n=1 Tax=Strigomonas culicis TaxID=28005 RepID=S9UWW3_9TRYP|nr:Rab family, other [Strigomonas culicis]|eukprot:EPY33259.1 Rab family, other [Strigomonas culicis]
MVLLRLRLAVVGEPTSGKTAFVQMVSSNGVTFPRNYLMTMGCDFIVKDIPLSDEDSVEVTLLDVGGQKLYDRMVPAYLDGIAAFFLVYDVSNKSTFEMCKKWLTKVTTARKDAIGYLIANKMDLADKCEVTDSQGEVFARHNNLKFVKCSALRATGINEPLEEISRTYLEMYKRRVSQLKA